MTDPRFDRLAGELLASAELAPMEPSEEERTRAVAAMQAALIAGARREQRRRGVSVALALAAGLAAVIATAAALRHRGDAHEGAVRVVAQPLGGGALVVSSEGTHPLSGETSVGRGARVVADEHGGAALALSTGSRVTLEPRADVTIVEHGSAQRFALAGGALRADVAKLAAGERFVVMTLDAEVEVRGTSFHVAVVEPDPRCERAVRTRVEVFEGAVRVRGSTGEAIVAAGESWPPPCAPARAEPALPDPAPAVAPEVIEPPAPRSAVRAGPTSGARLDAEPSRELSPEPSRELSPEPSRELDPETTPPIPEVEPSRLVEMNDLFAAAVAAERRGDRAEAAAGYEALLDRFPEGPLSEVTRAAWLRCLRTTDPARARAVARDYLDRHPSGAARGEAEALLGAGE